MKTYMWKWGKGKYCFQTDNIAIHQKLKSRSKAILHGCGFNCHFWLYILPYRSLNAALAQFRRFAGKAKIIRKNNYFTVQHQNGE